MKGYLHHTKSLITTVDEFDFNERIKPSAVMEYFQDLATVHAAEIGIGYEEMKARDLCWVLNRLSAVIDCAPYLGQEIVITTYPHKPGIADAVRDYYITDINGKSLIRGTSRWCVLDTKSKRVRRCAPLFSYSDDMYRPDFAVSNGNPQLITDNTGDVAVTADRVRITDLDRNGHMNNARYADIVVNACDYAFYATHTIKEFHFNFLSEMRIGDTCAIHHCFCENKSAFAAFGKDENEPIFRAEIRWQ